MQVPLVDLKAQYKTIKPDVDKVIKSVIDSTRFIGGSEVENFEKEFSNYIGAKYCIALNSGTDALILGMRALELEPGDEIIIPSNTFFATALGATENNLKPVFVETNEEDYGINLGDLKRKINAKTKAIIAVHLYGQPEKLSEIKNIIKTSGKKIHLVEDAAQAHGAFYKNKRVGTFGVFSAFSFYPGKNLGAYGDGGAIVTNNKSLAEKYRLYREYGQMKKYYHEVLGVNSRLDAIQAAILRIKLKHLDDWNNNRRKIAKEYNKLLEPIETIKTPKEFSNRKSVFHLYVVRAKDRDELLEFLNKNDIGAQIHYPIPLHQQKAFANLNHTSGELKTTEKLSDEIISLPIYPEMKSKMVKYIVAKIKEFYSK